MQMPLELKAQEHKSLNLFTSPDHLKVMKKRPTKDEGVIKELADDLVNFEPDFAQ